MKKVFLVLALSTFVVSMATTSYAAVSGVKMELKDDHKKKNKKKKKACCSSTTTGKTCTSTEQKSCCSKKSGN
jgi:hypothetical protein